MDQKARLWKKRSSEKTIVSNGDEAQSVIPIKKETDLESCLKSLTEKLDSVLDECSSKDRLVESSKKMAFHAMSDKARAEEEAQRLRGELAAVLQQRDTANEQLSHLNSAFKDNMDQLHAIRDDHECRLRDAVAMALQESEEKLASANAESSYLGKALLVKEKLIEDLNIIRSRMEAEFEALMTRLDSTEKENAFLRCENRTLESELDVRNEEFEYCLRSSEASHKQHSESVKTIKKLEADCQRLRSLTRKRLPGPHDIRVPGRNLMDSPDNASRKLGNLVEQARDLEKENKILKECLAKRDEEILVYKKELGFGSVDSREITSCRSWDNALVAERKHDKFGGRHECKMIGAPDMRLMDDFVEMEKLAIVAVDSLSLLSESVPLSGWLKNVVDAILEQHGTSKRSVEDLLGDVRTALIVGVCPEPPKLLPISGYLTWKSPASTPRSDSVHGSSNEFLHSCNNLSDGKISSEKFIRDSASTLGWIVDNSVLCEDRSTIRDEFRKHLGGDGPGTAFELECVQSLMLEIEKMFSTLQAEVKGLKDHLNSARFSDKDSAQETVASLKNELEISKEWKRMTEDQIDSMKLINEDLNNQLTSAKSRLNELLQELSCVEVELENKSHRCEELEATCLELQRQLESLSKNQALEGNANREELLETGLEITRASTKLAECEETILKLGKQLKAMSSTRELSVMDKVLSIAGTTNKMFKQRSSLRDQMLSEDSAEAMRQMVATARPSVSRTNSRDYLSFSDLRAKKESGALVIISSKKRGGGFGLLTKLLLRRKKSGCKTGTTSLR